MDFAVTITDPVTNIVTLGIPKVPKVLRGLNKLAQVVILDFLRNPGQDVLNPTSGAGFRAMIGQFNFTSSGEIQAEVLRRVRQREKVILANQPVGVGTPDERLKSLKLEDVAFDENTGSLAVRIKVQNEAGSTADILV